MTTTGMYVHCIIPEITEHVKKSTTENQTSPLASYAYTNCNKKADADDKWLAKWPCCGHYETLSSELQGLLCWKMVRTLVGCSIILMRPSSIQHPPLRFGFPNLARDAMSQITHGIDRVCSLPRYHGPYARNVLYGRLWER